MRPPTMASSCTSRKRDRANSSYLCTNLPPTIRVGNTKCGILVGAIAASPSLPVAILHPIFPNSRVRIHNTAPPMTLPQSSNISARAKDISSGSRWVVLQRYISDFAIPTKPVRCASGDAAMALSPINGSDFEGRPRLSPQPSRQRAWRLLGALCLWSDTRSISEQGSARL